MDRTHRACSWGAWSVVVGVLVEEGVLQCVAVCCSVLQCVALSVCCSVLQCLAVCCIVSVLQCVAVCCSVLQCVAVVVVLAVLEDEESRVFSVL